MYAGWGICHGIGAAIVYVSTCSCIQKWFPEFKGLATGIAVMGFGVGSFIWTTVGEPNALSGRCAYRAAYALARVRRMRHFALLLLRCRA